MSFFYAVIAVLTMTAAAFLGAKVAALRWMMGIALPYAAMAAFLSGLVYRVLTWARADVPFRIPTTTGQQKSLPWIRHARLESPATKAWTVARMMLEVLLFRSLFRNSRIKLREGARLAYSEEKFLWLGAMAFHWSLLVILIRHLRFFMEPVPRFVLLLQELDGFFQLASPVLYATDVLIAGSLLFLLLRRLRTPVIRYISMFSDYFALWLFLGLVSTGAIMRYFARVEILPIKQTMIGLITFSPHVPDGLSPLFFAHLILLSALLAYFPFSKLVHMAGVFLTPTRNLPNDNRMRRHVNPWNYPVKVHTYGEWEDEFRDRIKAAGLPLERQ